MEKLSLSDKAYELEVRKTARYFMLGDLNKETRQIWIVLHGYGQLANYFIRNFKPLISDNKTVVIAPEGLHRFYLSGFKGRIGASWMTKESRASDITDYVGYLNKLYQRFTEKENTAKLKINLLGFSQGAATLCRWYADGKVKADNIILWAGLFPLDIDYNTGTVFNNTKVTMLYGDQDEFRKVEEENLQLKALKKTGINVRMINFKGGHEIQVPVLMKLNKDINKAR
jgi:predicted esterase